MGYSIELRMDYFRFLLQLRRSEACVAASRTQAGVRTSDLSAAITLAVFRSDTALALDTSCEADVESPHAVAAEGEGAFGIEGRQCRTIGLRDTARVLAEAYGVTCVGLRGTVAGHDRRVKLFLRAGA